MTSGVTPPLMASRHVSGFRSMAILCSAISLVTFEYAAGQAPPDDPPPMADTVFKNVQMLKGIPVDEFMDTMGMFASALGYDCTSCHVSDVLQDRSAFAVATPSIQRARAMIAMMNNLNRTYFGGQPRVSCFTCHRGQYTPEVVPSLALQYGDVIDDPSAMQIALDRSLSAGELLDEYLEAIGSTERLSRLTSYVATGTYSGFNTGGADVPVEILARAPDQRVTIVRAPDGDSIRTYDGRSGWVAESWRPLPLMPLTGGNLEGARLEAMLAFPAQIREAFTDWQAGTATIDDRDVRIAQGRNGSQLPVNFYFDESGLLVRVVRWNRTAVGTVPTQIDFEDYREVAGVRLPFRSTVTWTDGQNTTQFTEVRPNVAIDAARFTRPAPFRAR